MQENFVPSRDVPAHRSVASISLVMSAAFVVSVFASCARAPVPVEPNLGRTDPIASYRPGLLQETTTGSVMLEQQEGATYLPAYELVGEISVRGVRPPPAGAHEWVARHNYKGPCAGGRYVITTPGFHRGVVGFIVAEDGTLACQEAMVEIRPHRLLKASGRTWSLPGLAGKALFRPRAPLVLSGKRFRWELLYGGRTGDDILIMYREYSGDFSTPSLVQNLSYNVKQSSHVVFRTIDIEVVEATSRSIVFRVWTAAAG